MFAARNLAAQGKAEESEALLRASVEAFRTCGDHWMILYGLGMLAGMEESHGSLFAAADAYEELIVACRAAGMTHFESMWLIRLAALRARLGDDVAAEQLFADAVTTNTRLANSAALIGRAGSARRLGDLTSSRRWLDEAKAMYDVTDLAAESASAFIGLAWWSIAAGDLTGAEGYVEEARQRATRAADPLIAVLADTVAAAVALSASDTEVNRTRFADVLDRRTRAGRSTAFLAATLDEPDVEALVSAYGLDPA